MQDPKANMNLPLQTSRGSTWVLSCCGLSATALAGRAGGGELAGAVDGRGGNSGSAACMRGLGATGRGRWLASRTGLGAEAARPGLGLTRIALAADAAAEAADVTPDEVAAVAIPGPLAVDEGVVAADTAEAGLLDAAAAALAPPEGGRADPAAPEAAALAAAAAETAALSAEPEA